MALTGQETYETLFEGGPLREATGTSIRPGGTLLTGRAVRFCGFAPGSDLIDVGCGTGATVEYLRTRHGLHAVGVDPSLRLLEEGWERNPDLPMGLGHAKAIPLADASKDGLFCECVLSLLNEPVQALNEFHRVLRPGGRLVMSDLYERTPGGNDRSSGLLSRDRLEGMLCENGFTLLLWEDHSRLLREMAARLVMAHGSLDEYWRTTGITRSGGERPGYYLLVASKGMREDM